MSPPLTLPLSHCRSHAAALAGSVAELCRDADAVAWLLGELNATGKENKTKGFEAIKALLLEPEQFSVDNDCLTPTFKFKRPQLQKRYQVRSQARCTALWGGGAHMDVARPRLLGLLFVVGAAPSTATVVTACLHALRARLPRARAAQALTAPRAHTAPRCPACTCCRPRPACTSARICCCRAPRCTPAAVSSISLTPG